MRFLADSPRLQNCLRWFGLVVGCFAKFVTGSLFVFNAYEGALKATFNYTETEVELQSSLLNVGLGVGFVPGMFYDKFGPTWTSLVGLLVSVGSYLLLWSTTKSVSFYRDRSWLTAVYFFLSGFGSVFTYMVALNTNVINFHSKHRGKIVGLLNAFCAGSPSVFAAIYYNIISVNFVSDRERFETFMLLFAITFSVVNILCVPFLRIYPTKQHEEQKPLLADDTNRSVNSSLEKDNQSSILNQPMGLKQLFFNLNFHIFVWMLAFAASVGQVYVNNLTEIATTVLGTSGHNSGLVLIIPIVNSIVSLCVGLISDKFKNRVPRLTVFIFGGCMFVLSQTLVLTLSYRYAFLVVGTTVAGIAIGTIWSIGPAITSEMFHVSNLGRNWGIGLLLASIVGFAQQEIFGTIYESKITTRGEIYCYGMDCIRGGVALSLSSAVVSIILGITLWIKTRKTDRRPKLNIHRQ